ncbi:PAS domain-containing protein [Polaromonas sp. CG_9.11]|uniref:hybrid sensor histidine kinase/response regulator n=1 Tax=Polaromonas sp. CG_9.11 TaxID=2787730 RepID=UPI0018CA385F|nr:PAS domain-containing protein [Polaromonas sp. CG_9.11]MBG6075560.1 PAS domain S-box-containing protein [Polaromonas sp. CG_9.11]
MTQESKASPGFLRDGGTAGALMRSHGWARSPLGPPDSWPQALQTVAGLMLRSATPVFVAWGPELCLLYNDACLKILGQRHPAALGQPLYQVWPEVRPDIEPLINQTLAGEAVHRECAPFLLRRNGVDEQAWFNFSYAPVDGPDGTVAGLYCALAEITAKVLSEKNRRTETQWLYSMFEQAPSFMAVVREPGHVYELANSAYLRLVGRDGVVGKTFMEIGRKVEGQDYGALLDAVYATGKPFIGTRMPVIFSQHAKGQPERRLIDFIFQPITSPEGVVSGVFIEGNDVTEHARAEDALRQTVLKYHTIANAIPQIVWGTQPDGFHDYYNQQWYDYTGVARGATHGEAWKELFHSEDLLLAVEKWRHCMATGEFYEVEYRLRHHSGQYRWVLARARPMRDAQGLIVRWVGTCTDIHEQKLAQQGLQHADRLKDEFLAMLAHELRNPLAPIATAADLLSRGTLDQSGVLQLSEVISRQARHMTRLIDDLLDVSRVTRGQVKLDRQPVDLKTIANEALEQIRPLLEAKAHHLDIQLSPECTQVMGDRLRLVQVLVNVLGNAIRYTPNGGRIDLRMLADDGHLTLRVLDNGIGMSSELLEVAFELFTQGERSSDRSQGGLGIGLALVRSLVQLHGGSVKAHSDGIGRGSEVTVVLPRLAQDHEQHGVDAGAAACGPEGTPLRILVVDDNVDAARLLGMFIELLGHEVFVQFHPADAIECARRVLPHLCLLDIGLPDMDGYTLARQLRLIPGMQTAVLAAVTGYSQPRDKQAAFAAGFNFHFAKPIDSGQLQVWLAQVTEQARRQDQPVIAQA